MGDVRMPETTPGSQRQLPETTLDDVLATFGPSRNGMREYETWRQGGRPDEVVAVASSLRMRFVYKLTVEDVEGVCRRTKHALGKIDKTSIDGIDDATNWSPDFAFTHIFGYYVERNHDLPTWQSLLDFVWDDDTGYAMLGGRAVDKFEALDSRFGAARAKDALYWRMGLAYYSFLRETHAVTVLRAAGIDIRIHPIADAIFKADGWCGNKILSLRIGNARFKDGKKGRKRTADQVLNDARSEFRFATVQLPCEHKYGVVWLADPAKILDVWNAVP
jgi:hypothetical protein